MSIRRKRYIPKYLIRRADRGEMNYAECWMIFQGIKEYKREDDMYLIAGVVVGVIAVIGLWSLIGGWSILVGVLIYFLGFYLETKIAIIE